MYQTFWWFSSICLRCNVANCSFSNCSYFSYSPLYRVFGRLVLVPFLDGRRSPKGLDAQQTAENHAEEVFAVSSSAIGILVGLRQNLDFILKQRAKDVASELARSIPDMDDRCVKNYTVLISLAEKVSASLVLNISFVTLESFHEVMVCVCLRGSWRGKMGLALNNIIVGKWYLIHWDWEFLLGMGLKTLSGNGNFVLTHWVKKIIFFRIKFKQK